MTGPRERWRRIACAPRYEVSDLGRVRSLFDNHLCLRNAPLVRRTAIDHNGYEYVILYVATQTKIKRFVHVLVLEAFRGPCPEGTQTRHRNGKRTSNRLNNLCWGTPKENGADKVAHGRSLRGSRNPKAKLTERHVRDVLARLRRGESKTSIATRYGVTRVAIYLIAAGRNWPHIAR